MTGRARGSRPGDVGLELESNAPERLTLLQISEKNFAGFTLSLPLISIKRSEEAAWPET